MEKVSSETLQSLKTNLTQLFSAFNVGDFSYIIPKLFNCEKNNPALLLLFLYATDIPTLRSLMYDILYGKESEKKTAEYSNINSMYKEVLNNTKKSYEELRFNNPVQTYTATRFALNRGILSKDKSFQLSYYTRNFADILGPEVMCGKGVCRHVSGLLTDINNSLGIKSHIVAVKYDSHTEKSIESKEVPLQVEPIKIAHVMLVLGYLYTELRSLLGGTNHAVTCSEDNNKSFALDLTNAIIYRPDSNGKILIPLNDLNHKTETDLKPRTVGHLIYFRDIEAVKLILNKPTIDYEEYRQIWSKTLQICEQNIGMFDDLYNQNKDLYDGIVNEFDKVRPLMKKIEN